eukprot:349897-Chlamydomonas_euryale.AAC.2
MRRLLGRMSPHLSKQLLDDVDLSLVEEEERLAGKHAVHDGQQRKEAALKLRRRHVLHALRGGTVRVWGG